MASSMTGRRRGIMPEDLPNRVCQRCIRDCKQRHDVVVVQCRLYLREERKAAAGKR